MVQKKGARMGAEGFRTLKFNAFEVVLNSTKFIPVTKNHSGLTVYVEFYFY